MVAMVAAGSKGIGLAVAQNLAAEGAVVSICSRTRPELDLGSSIFWFQADVSKRDDLEEWHKGTISDHGSPQILVTNTGGPPAGNIADLTDEQWLLGFENTVLNVVRMSRLVVADMKKHGFGRIVHITSLYAKEPSSVLAISSTLRAGIMAMTKLQSDAFATFGITVNSVLPGHTLTDRQRHLAEIQSEQQNIPVEEVLKLRGESIPVGRIADPQDIASCVSFLCSKQASFLTGTNLVVDGGTLRGLV